MRASVKDRVAAGATLLDEKRPDWVDRIDLDSLDMASPWCCILGQVYGSFGTGLGHIDIANEEGAECYGLAAVDAPSLHTEWTELILDRREAVTT